MREYNELRNVRFTTNYTIYAEGSVLVEFGKTKVICNATIEDKVPFFLKGTGNGWITSEYSMLPRATDNRKARESVRGRQDGRNQEIQRLIGRSLRTVVDMTKIGERTIWIDCDVIQADGGTRTASISGGFVALCLAIKKIYDNGKIKQYPVNNYVSAVSVGIVNGKTQLDLEYSQDSSADVDMNIVMTDNNEFIEIQGTGEKASFNKKELSELLELAEIGNKEIISKQKKVLGEEITELIDKNKKVEIDEIILATGNKNKIKEIKELLKSTNIIVKTPQDYNLENIEIIEDKETFEENAIKKAETYSKLTGKITIADDSGLEVEYLDGKPGIYSKRYSGEDSTDEKNNEKLIKNLLGTTLDQRRARFVCTIAIYFPNKKTHIIKEYCNGKIGFEPKGDNGFGYDPLFIPDENNEKRKSFAELSQEEKSKISHRGKAIRKLIKYITKK